MKQYLVERPNGNVIVTILSNKSDHTYSYVNLTKGHICPCRFASEEEAYMIWIRRSKAERFCVTFFSIRF